MTVNPGCGAEGGKVKETAEKNVSVNNSRTGEGAGKPFDTHSDLI